MSLTGIKLLIFLVKRNLFTSKEIHKILNKILKEFKFDEKNEEPVFNHIMFVILLFTKCKCLFETLCLKYINSRKLDLFLIYEEYVIIVVLKYNKICEDTLKCIIERIYCDKFMQDKEFVVNKYNLLGLNMNKNKNIDMYCLINKNNLSKNSIIIVALIFSYFTIYYSTCKKNLIYMSKIKIENSKFILVI